MKRNFSIKFLVAILSILTIGCNNDNLCEMPLEGENYLLSDSIKSYLSNYINADRIIFKTNSGDEISFMISNFNDTLVSYQFERECESDINFSQSVKGTSQVIQNILFNPVEITIPIFISLLQIPRPDDLDIKESVVVTLGDFFSTSEQGNFLFEHNVNGTNQFTIFKDSLEISGKMFYSVFETSNLSPIPTLDIKYTKNEGVVYMKNMENGKEYIYERKE